MSFLDLGSTLTYQFSNGATAGAYLDYADADIDTGLGFDLSGDTTSYGVTDGCGSFGSLICAKPERIPFRILREF
ncbi:hypothetical protein [Ruegeria arenilitoris]|uniref:hypothetical protein n=1 Tax=Ruegeria arenilitoris TaxID=1173585 RepID=UPI00148047E0|nr:hypothetical protein [Ruegeria arenilitoris]